jgi:hypothetical protein
LYALLFEKNINEKTSIKFSDLKKNYLSWIINRLIIQHITADTLAQKFIDKCESLRFPASNINININSYHSYVYKFLRSEEPQDQKNRITKETVVKVIEALINDRNSEFDNYQLNYGNQFTIDIARMCGSKKNLLTDIDILVKQLQDELVETQKQVKQLQVKQKDAKNQIEQLQGELKATEEQIKQLHDDLAAPEEQVAQLQDDQQQAEEAKLTAAVSYADIHHSQKNNSGYTALPVDTGGNKSKKLPKKDILGKTKSIHKIPGDRKEYVKHKGKLITVKSYKELMKKKK